MQTCAPIDVLLVEDEAADTYVIKRVMADTGDELRLWVVTDGPEALLFVRKAPPFTHVPTPRLILLDLRLPRMDGLSVLRRVRSLPDHHTTPIVIFSALPRKREEAHCRQLGANEYVQKSMDFTTFCHEVQAIVHRWLLPSHSP